MTRASRAVPRKAMGDETTKRSAVTVAVLVLASCHVALALSNISAPREHDDDDDPLAASRGVELELEPVGYVASLVSTVVAACVASVLCGGGGHRVFLSLGGLLAEARRTWARPAATAVYVELLTSAMASLLLTLGAFLGAASASGAAAGLLTASGSVTLVGWLGPVLFAHSDIACRMSLVVAAAEGSHAGRAAVRRASGIAVGLAAGAIEQAPAWLFGDAAPALVLGPAVLAAKIAACCACAVFYYDCWRRHEHDSVCGGGGSALELHGMSRCRQMDGWDVADGCEREEFWSAFECFRLT